MPSRNVSVSLGAVLRRFAPLSAPPRGSALALVVALGVALVGACARGPRPPSFPTSEPGPELTEPEDLRRAEDELWALPVGPQRSAARAPVSEVLAAQLRRTLRDAPSLAGPLVARWLRLWHDDPELLGGELGAHRELLVELRAAFAARGQVEPALLALAALQEVEPTRAAQHRAEIDEVLEFVDAGEALPERRGRAAMAALAPIVQALPSRWLVDRYLALLETRQRDAAALLGAPEAASYRHYLARREATLGSYHAAAALAHAGRIHELPERLARLYPATVDPALSHLATALRDHPGPDELAALAGALREGPTLAPQLADATAALAVVEAALARYPARAELYTLAGELAASLGRVDQPLRLYRAALALAPAPAARVLPRRIAAQLSAQLEREARAGRATRATARLDELHAWIEPWRTRDPGGPWRELLAGAQAAVGRAWLAQGEPGRALELLELALRGDDAGAALTLADALLRLDRARDAVGVAERALARLAGDVEAPAAAEDAAPAGSHAAQRERASRRATHEQHEDARRARIAARAELERLAGDALRGLREAAYPAGEAPGLTEAAAQRYYEALRQWTSLPANKELAPPLVARRLASMARSMWWLDDPQRGVSLLHQALDAAPDGELAVCAEGVAFLLEQDHYADALELYHRGLRADGGEDAKVRMSLWLLVEGRRRGGDDDPEVLALLRGRAGDRWSDRLARAAVGEAPLPELARDATTRVRAFELAFYTAALGLDPQQDARRLLQQVVDAQLLMRVEHQLARRWLAAPPPAPAKARP
ncbi:MAG: hypothetical protein R3B48_01045 [Kofleriaceae bacterium]